MRICLSNIVYILVVLCLYSSSLFAGAWTQKKGHFYSKLTLIRATSNQRFDFMKHEEDFTFNDQAAYFYFEYGIFDKSTFIFATPILKESEANYFTFKGTTQGVFSGDMDIQFKQAILSGPIVLSALAGINIPLPYKTDDTPPLGAGIRSYDLKILAGTSFYPLPAYFTGDIGYRFKEGEFENEVSFNVEAGYTILNKFLFRLIATGVRSVDINVGEQSFSQFSFEQEQYRVGTGLIYLFKKSIEFDVTFLKTTAGRSFPKFTEIYFGVAFKR